MPMTAPQPQQRRLQANGLDFAILEMGEGPLVLCLHGFPDTAWSFVPVMRELAAAGYRVVAPFMRGYLPTAVPADGDYRVTALADDVIALIDALGGPAAAVIGHDWGSIAAQCAAIRKPGCMQRLVACAVPHPGHFVTRPSLRQLRRSYYIGFFQLPWLPERTIVVEDFRWLQQLIRRWSPGWDFTAADLAPLKASLCEPAHLAAALGYYRQLPRSIADRKLWHAPVTVPTLAISGGRDGCIGPEMFERQQGRYRAGYQLYCMEDAGHFMQCEQPAAFAESVLAFIRD